MGPARGRQAGTKAVPRQAGHPVRLAARHCRRALPRPRQPAQRCTRDLRQCGTGTARTCPRINEPSSEERTFQSDTAEKEDSLYRLYLEPKWAGVSLNGIKRLAVKQWVATDLKVRPGMSAAYVRKIFGLFRLIMNAAVDHEVLDASPCVRIKLPEIPKKAKPFVTTVEASEMRG